MAGEPITLSGVNVVLVMAYGSLVFVLLFIFVKRQIMRFAMKSRRGPHVPLGHNAPKELREEIDFRLSKVNDIRFEPTLLSKEDNRLKHQGRTSCYNYLYRMQALDAIRDSDIPFHEMCRSASALTGRRYKNWLMELRNSHSVFKSSNCALIDRLLEGYDNARHGAGVFGEPEYVKYKQDLAQLATIVKTHSSTTSLNQQHQSAAKDLTSSSGPSNASTIQVTYLPSTGQRSKRPKHFLELKNFKDNYNTLESTL
ncbi:protein C1orf43 homolog [Triplophysa dalaica]|uniref:protein C1orf43 homolog n=1 Tax=Triplophysa dalaica TaxID=1582913 RepID=UPI0024DFA534|nr:protein C1orf43 homolog [Triplophysa dalaica]